MRIMDHFQIEEGTSLPAKDFKKTSLTSSSWLNSSENGTWLAPLWTGILLKIKIVFCFLDIEKNV